MAPAVLLLAVAVGGVASEHCTIPTTLPGTATLGSALLQHAVRLGTTVVDEHAGLQPEDILSVVHQVKSATALDEHGRLNALQQTLETLSGKPKPGAWGSDEKTALEAVLAEIDGDMTDFLLAEKHDDEALWALELSKQASCHTVTVKRFGAGGDVKAEADAAAVLADKHKSCRKVEKSLADYIDASTCPQSASLSVWPPQPHADHDNLYNKISKLRLDADAYATLSPGSPECDIVQTNYESQFCFWRREKRFTCQEEADCIAIVNLPNTKLRLGSKASNRRDMRILSANIGCLIKHLLKSFATGPSNFTEQHNCTQITVDPAVDAIEMTIPPSPECLTDWQVAVHPSSESAACKSWREAQYPAGAWAAEHIIPGKCLSQCELEPVKPLPLNVHGMCQDQYPSVPAGQPENLDFSVGAPECAAYNHTRSYLCPAEAKRRCCSCGGGFVIPGNKADNCPSGSAPMTKEECKAFKSETGRSSWSESSWSGAAQTHPKTCFIEGQENSRGRVYWNTHPEGGGSLDGHADIVCKHEVAEAD